MHWRAKARLQNAIALLPSELSYALYYRLQRTFGGLRRANPVSRLRAGIEACDRLSQLGRQTVGKAFLEIGTGRTLSMPLAFWLRGAASIVTVDLNPYLRDNLVQEELIYIRDHEAETRNLFHNHLDEDRLSDLLRLVRRSWSREDLFQLLNLEYRAPADAAQLAEVPSQSVDYQVSYTVFEHIPPNVLPAILHEGERILKRDGLFLHHVDFSDHFAHSDSSISSVNFLQFSDAEWSKLADNRYMYMNRLRIDDFLEIYRECGHRILLDDRTTDADAMAALAAGLKLDGRFAGKAPEVLSVTRSWIVSEASKTAADTRAA